MLRFGGGSGFRPFGGAHPLRAGTSDARKSRVGAPGSRRERKEETSMPRAKREAAFTAAMVLFLLAMFWIGTVGSMY